MRSWLARRLLGAVPLVLGVATLVFLLVNLAPGDPTSILLDPGLRAETAERMRSNFGLDDPLHVRYVKWLGSLFTGDFGHSYSHGRPVASVLLQALPNTLLLTGSALVLAFLGGMAVGVYQAVRRRSIVDSALSVVALFFYSVPSFWLAIMMVLVFALGARNIWEWPIYFPSSGIRSPDYFFMGPFERVLDRAYHLVLPATTLALVIGAGVSRYMRDSAVEALGQDYVRTARAKGLPERTVVLKHALRNALIPVISLLGLYLPVLFSGAVFVETVFAWPGMGWIVVEAIVGRDYPLIMAGSFLFAVLVVLGNLLADILYAVVDPRIRYEGRAAPEPERVEVEQEMGRV